MFGVYRKQIVEKSEKMGLPWKAFMQEQMEQLPQLKVNRKLLPTHLLFPSFLLEHGR